MQATVIARHDMWPLRSRSITDGLFQERSADLSTPLARNLVLADRSKRLSQSRWSTAH